MILHSAKSLMRAISADWLTGGETPPSWLLIPHLHGIQRWKKLWRYSESQLFRIPSPPFPSGKRNYKICEKKRTGQETEIIGRYLGGDNNERSLHSKKGHRTNHISKVFPVHFDQSVKCLGESKGESFMVRHKCEPKPQHGTRHMSDDLHS